MIADDGTGQTDDHDAHQDHQEHIEGFVCDPMHDPTMRL